MSTKPRRILAALVAALAASSAVVATGGATTAASAADQQRVDLAFTARAFGAGVYTNDISVQLARFAATNLGCTKTVGRTMRSSALTPPTIGDMITVEGVKSSTTTYRSDGRTGVRAVNRIAKVSLGAEGTPRLVLRGFRSVADAYRKNGRFGTESSFTFDGISIAGLPDDGGPIGDLLDLIGGGADEVLAALGEGQTIEIPGLAKLSLAASYRGVKQGERGSAQQRTSGLRIKIIPGSLAAVNLGNTRARVSQPVPAGVFQGGTAAVDGELLNEEVGFGTPANLINCEGTFGKKVVDARAQAGVADPVVIDVTDQRSEITGTQSGRTGAATNRITVGSVKILPPELAPLLPTVQVDDITSRSAVTGNPSKGKVTTTLSSTVGTLLIAGEKRQVPKPGQTRTYENGAVEVTRRIRTSGASGGDIAAIRITYLPAAVNSGLDPIVMDLGQTSAYFKQG